VAANLKTSIVKSEGLTTTEPEPKQFTDRPSYAAVTRHRVGETNTQPINSHQQSSTSDEQPMIKSINALVEKID
jgi:hypothetical protein